MCSRCSPVRLLESEQAASLPPVIGGISAALMPGQDSIQELFTWSSISKDQLHHKIWVGSNEGGKPSYKTPSKEVGRGRLPAGQLCGHHITPSSLLRWKKKKNRKIQVRHLFALNPAVFPPHVSRSKASRPQCSPPAPPPTDKSHLQARDPRGHRCPCRSPASCQTDDTARPKAFPSATSLALAGDVFSAALVLALPFCKAIGGRFYRKNLQGMYGQWLLNNIFSIMFPKARVKKIINK